MKNLLVILAVLFLSNCATTSNLINYDNTNPVKIEQSIQGLEINKVLPDAGELDGKIAIKSIELDNAHNLDIGVSYMIEDNMISNLINNDYKVVERDPEILSALHSESGSKYKMHIHNEEDDADVLPDNSSINIVNATINLTEDDEKRSEQLIDTELETSDYILSYRVLECGVVYNELQNSIDLNQNAVLNIERSARTRLHVRLTDSKTSEIIASDILENEITDIVSKEKISDLQQITHEYYHHTLPNKGLILASAGLSEDSGYKFTSEDIKIEKSQFDDDKTLLRIGGGFVAAMLLLAAVSN